MWVSRLNLFFQSWQLWIFSPAKNWASSFGLNFSDLRYPHRHWSHLWLQTSLARRYSRVSYWPYFCFYRLQSVFPEYTRQASLSLLYGTKGAYRKWRRDKNLWSRKYFDRRSKTFKCMNFLIKIQYFLISYYYFINTTSLFL